jgi:hypothetical protein
MGKTLVIHMGVRDVKDVPREALEDVVRRVQEILWQTADGWDVTKPWNQATFTEIARALDVEGLALKIGRGAA